MAAIATRATGSAFGVKRVAARRSVAVQASAVPPNVAEAREWIASWKSKQARPAKWFPGNDAPEWLDGSMVGDYGYDPLGFCKEDFYRRWYQQAELMNGRTAMVAVAGILVPELMQKVGLPVGGQSKVEVPWFAVDKVEFYAPASALTAISLFLFHFVETRRFADFLNPGSQNQDPFHPQFSLPASNPVGYPGFDPLGYSKGGNFRELQEKEMKNGRLAMLAFAGFATVAWTQGLQPVAALAKHLSDPWATTVFSIEHARL